jgi:hypothetical protein
LAPCNCLPESACASDRRHGKKPLPAVSSPTSKCEDSRLVLVKRSSRPLVVAVVASSGEVVAALESLLPCRPPAQASAAGTAQVSRGWCQHAPVLTAGATILLAGERDRKFGRQPHGNVHVSLNKTPTCWCAVLVRPTVVHGSRQAAWSLDTCRKDT